tara:strand:- start:673 stop:876 length:204 start_codon:yes stop_codon:yes gene_type:complete
MNEAQFLELGAKVSRSSIAIIDAISQRGAFKGEELSTVGQLRDQCVQLVQQVEERQQEMDDDEEDEE